MIDPEKVSCPFCGEIPTRIKHSVEYGDEVVCETCCIEIPEDLWVKAGINATAGRLMRKFEDFGVRRSSEDDRTGKFWLVVEGREESPGYFDSWEEAVLDAYSHLMKETVDDQLPATKP
jgi:hypothetical protein